MKTKYSPIKTETKFDIEQPNLGHELRFLKKLETQKLKTNKSFWKPLLSIAASIVLIITATFTIIKNNAVTGLASVSPEMAKTESFFTLTIANEIEKLKKQASPEHKNIINDALFQINKLENSYQNLVMDLKTNTTEERIIYAMISNFQDRIEILQSVLHQINFNKKENTNENTII